MPKFRFINILNISLMPRWATSLFGISLLATVLMACQPSADSPTKSQGLLIAVASNFATTMQKLADDYQNQTNVKVTLSLGSSGKHFAQIQNGAPYDAFFSADQTRPQKLEQLGFAVSGSRKTYAVGQLAVYCNAHETDDRLQANKEPLEVKLNWAEQVAIANPKTAPYGLAAKQALEKLELWQAVADKLVFADNINQANQYLLSQSVDCAFIANSQLIGNRMPNQASSSYLLDPVLHDPIEQQRVVIKDSAAMRAFLDFLEQPTSQKTILQAGYTLSP